MSDPIIQLVRVDGLDELVRITNPERAQAVIRRSLKRIGLIVERESKKVTPVKSGTLKRSITSVMIGDDTVAIGTSVRYGLYVHEGTRNADQTVRMAKRPFLVWGIENGSQRIQDELDRAIEQVVTP
jgi:phage gpG-like protein